MGFTEESANIACKILKYDNSQTYTSFREAECDSEISDFWLKNVKCVNGNKDSKLSACTNDGFGNVDSCAEQNCLRIICQNEEDIDNG